MSKVKEHKMLNLFIWWTNQSACESVGKSLPKEYPQWLRDQYRSRHGRNGRGRLWVDVRFDTVDVSNAFDESSSMAKWLSEEYAGVVIDEEMMRLLTKNKIAGIITDLNLRHVSNSLGHRLGELVHISRNFAASVMYCLDTGRFDDARKAKEKFIEELARFESQ